MNFLELQTETNFVLDNNEGQTSQAFNTARIKKAVNYAYRDEMREAQLEGGKDWLKTVTTLVWPASQLDLILPASITQKTVVAFYDITHTATGEYLTILSVPQEGYPYWYDRNRLQWPLTGPSENKTLAVVFYPDPQDLIADADEPDLLPESYHDILPWSAAIYLLNVGDQSAPSSWNQTRDNLRMNFFKYISRSRPLIVPYAYPGLPSAPEGDATFPGGGLNNVA